MAYLFIVLTVVYAGMAFVLVTNLGYLAQGRRRSTRVPTPSISILIPARNEAGNLQRLLPSLLAQTYPDFEVIVYDDASEDDTWAVLQSFADPRLKPRQGTGPPPGWVGKVHALYQATRIAQGDCYLFLDADAELQDPEALQRLVEQHEALPTDSVLTGLTLLRGGGSLLVSLVPHAILIGLPWILVRRSRQRMLAALNGQCWFIRADLYHHHEPHQNLPGEILEDVQIGRYLKAQGVVPYLRDVQDEVAVYMYRDFCDAWRGFRKNAYLILGGTPASFMVLYAFYLFAFVAGALISPWFLAVLYVLKLVTDRVSRFPWWVSALAPVSFVLGALIQGDSALRHWTRRVDWKGRRVG